MEQIMLHCWSIHGQCQDHWYTATHALSHQVGSKHGSGTLHKVAPDKVVGLASAPRLEVRAWDIRPFERRQCNQNPESAIALH